MACPNGTLPTVDGLLVSGENPLGENPCSFLENPLEGENLCSFIQNPLEGEIPCSFLKIFLSVFPLGDDLPKHATTHKLEDSFEQNPPQL